MVDFEKSDKGAKAAWKGFSSQTTYIASRLIDLPEDVELHPEKVEDLLISSEKNSIELVQIKNLTSPLTLSDLKPIDRDSFFRRCLSIRDDNPDIVLKIVSFGEIGKELSSFTDSSTIEYFNIEKKLISMGYKRDEIQWISNRLSFEIVDEEKLINQIKESLSETVETMAAPELVLDILTQYVAKLSRYSEYTNKIIWNKKIQQIGIDLAALRGISKEYGNSFIPITEYKDQKTKDQLSQEYLAGINAQPQHIRLNLDIERPYWLDKIDRTFDENNLVLIKGASGQGKSTLAYRYLQNFYSENDVLCIQSITSETQAQNIIIALNGLAKKHENLIVYLDVSPLDLNWNLICEKHNAYGANFKLLVSIREEDYRRTNFDFSRTPISLIDLQLSKKEAELIFSMHSQTIFRSFQEAWKAFGEEGPMMEFVYLLNRSETLKQRLEFQVKRITEESGYTEDWLKALLIVSYAGQYGIEVDIQSLLKVCSLKQASTVFYLFEKEYLVKIVDEKKRLLSLHVLRAEILTKVLLEYLFISEEEAIFYVIETSFSNVQLLLISFFYNNEIDKKFIKSLSHLHFNSWETYSSVIKSLLWLEVRSLYLKNKDVLGKMDSYCPGNFPVFLLGDITGYYPNINGKDLLELIGESQPERLNNIETLIEMLPQKVITYKLLDEFLNQSKNNLPNIRLKKASEISSIGYCLFWFANREIYIDQNVFSFPDQLPVQNDLLDPLLNLVVGIQTQKWDHLYKEYYPTLIKMIKKNFGIVYLKENDNEYKAEYLFNMYNSESAGDQFSNDSIMAVIGALRRVDINRVKYSAKLIGDEIHSDIDIPEIKKNIKSEKLYWLWITEINSWYTKLHDYDLYSEKWNDVDKLLKICISKNSEIFKMLLNVFNRLYKKGNLNGIDFTDMINKINDLMSILNNSHLFYPKSSVDKYGINNDSYSLDPNEYRNRNNNEDSLGFQNQNQSKSDFSSIHREYCQKLVAFYENLHVLLGEKIRKETISHKSRVSYISLMEACELFLKLNAKYNDEFPLSTKEIISKDDLTVFRQVSSVWSHLFLNEIRIDRSFVYDRKEYFKRYQNRIDRFLDSEIKKIEGVINCVKIDNHYQIVVDVAQNDDFFTSLYYQFKKDLPEIGIMTFENSLWTNSFDYIEFRYSLKGFDIPPIYKIESKKFVFLEDSKLKTSLMACQTNKGVNVSNELLKNFLGYNTGLGDFSFYINHINDVFRSIGSSLYKEYFEVDIFSCWADKTMKFGQNLIYSIYQSIKQVNDYLISVFGDDDNISKIMNEITDGINHLEEEIQVILDNRSLTDSESLLKSFEGTFVKLQNSFQKFTVENDAKIQLCLEQIC